MNSQNLRTAALLVPVYNAERHISALAAMIAEQELPFAEVILYDDCSSDRTADAAEALGLKVIRGSKNGGAGFARNRLAEAASADWIHFHDADDRMFASYHRCLAPLLKDPRTAAMSAWRSTTGPGGPIRIDQDQLPSDWVAFFIAKFFHLNAFIFPREFFQEVGGFREDIRIGEDWEFLIRAAARGMNFNYLDEVLVEYVAHPDSTLNQASLDYWKREEEKRLVASLEILSPKYHVVLKDWLLYRAWWEYERGKVAKARAYIEIAKRFGFVCSSDVGHLGKIVSRFCGTEAFFFLKRQSLLAKGLVSARSS